jgi:hypoxanthine phosphoribosyltransferase
MAKVKKQTPPRAAKSGPPHPDTESILFGSAAIARRVKDLGRLISADHAREPFTLVPVLKGSIIFAADLLRAINCPCSLDFMGVSSYAGAESSGSPTLTMDLHESPEGKNILLVEDIVDSGYTLTYLINVLLSKNVRSVRVCALLDKKDCRRVPVKIDYCGFEAPNQFLVGYGLDYCERYRHLPYIAALKPAVLKP